MYAFFVTQKPERQVRLEWVCVYVCVCVWVCVCARVCVYVYVFVLKWFSWVQQLLSTVKSWIKSIIHQEQQRVCWKKTEQCLPPVVKHRWCFWVFWLERATNHKTFSSPIQVVPNLGCGVRFWLSVVNSVFVPGLFISLLHLNQYCWLAASLAFCVWLVLVGSVAICLPLILSFFHVACSSPCKSCRVLSLF